MIHHTPHLSCLQVTGLYLFDNSLTGPGFPAAWLRPGALAKLQAFAVNGNPGLTGAIPASLTLAWSHLSSL